jgi:hypothetical protein
MNAAGAGRGNGDCALGDPCDPFAVDILHREDMHA